MDAPETVPLPRPRAAAAVTLCAMIYVYSTANGAGRIMGYEPLEEPWPGLFLVGVFDGDQEEAGQFLRWLGGEPSVA